MRSRPCPVCGDIASLYVRRSGWLEILCAGCGEVLHGIAVDVLDGEVTRDEVA